ncbi:hypothetical protein HZH66_012331 [Vespula vulgaris]|uniref:Uncharacterized protein n=1 Tax=Vespula vulgaris TaxID=7454 RepID=A0A834MU27_VESVU|nr:hypothetical protein HZH66_012331 [Vespula vulgaris]
MGVAHIRFKRFQYGSYDVDTVAKGIRILLGGNIINVLTNEMVQDKENTIMLARIYVERECKFYNKLNSNRDKGKQPNLSEDAQNQIAKAIAARVDAIRYESIYERIYER